MEVRYLTIEQATTAINRCAFTEENVDKPDRQLVHCFLGGGGIAIGADWAAEDAISLLAEATVTDDVLQIAWMDSLFGRCLGVIAGGKLHTFDTVTPA